LNSSDEQAATTTITNSNGDSSNNNNNSRMVEFGSESRNGTFELYPSQQIFPEIKRVREKERAPLKGRTGNNWEEKE